MTGESILGLLRGYRTEGFERSFKMSAGRLLGDRFLAGIHKSDISPAALYGICARMEMPAPWLESMKPHAEAANAFHFGYEGQGEGGLCKVYLEFAQQLARVPAGRPEAPAKILLHLAYKWDASNPAKGTIARYECLPGLSLAEIRQRTAILYAGQLGSPSRQAVQEIVDASARRAKSPPMYLEVGEEGNPRASFDINLHEAEMSVAEIAPILERLRDDYAIPAARFAAVSDAAKTARLGHISGGISREGGDFLTVYYASDVPWAA